MADNFANYFPVSITGGGVNPATGLDAVQGQTPQPLGLDLILQGIQSQYTPQTFTQSGGSYGAGRFIDGGGSVAGVGSAVGGNAAQPWFLQGEFNLPSYEATIPTEVANKVAAGEIYGGSNYSPVSSTESSDWQYDPYSSLFNPVDPITGKLIGALIPGAGLIINAAQGYQNAIGTNAMNTALAAYGSEGMGDVDPFTAALMGVVGITPNSVKGAQAMASHFDSPENMYGYMSVAQDPAISQIAEAMIAQSGGTMNANQVGALGYAIGEAVNAKVAAGKSLNDAVQSVATGYGVAPSEAAAMAANLNVADPIGQLISNLQPQAMAPAPAPALPTPTPSRVSDSMINQANQSTDPIGSLINQILAAPPIQYDSEGIAIISSPSGGGGGGSFGGGGGGVRDSSGRSVTDSSGSPVGTRSWG